MAHLLLTRRTSLLFFSLACWLFLSQAQAQPKNWVVYHSMDKSTQDVDIRFINEDGTQGLTLVSGAGDDYFCEDLGDRIIYANTSNAPRDANLYSISKDGNDKIDLATGPGYEWFLGVVGDRMIYATEFSTNDFGNLYSVKLDGKDRKELALGAYYHGVIGDRLIYSLQAASRDIYAVGVDGTFRTPLANSSLDEIYLGHSGHQVLFRLDNGAENNVYTVEYTGEPRPSKMLNTSLRVIYGGVGPNGRVYFQVEYEYNGIVEADIWSTNGDGSSRMVLTTSSKDERALEAIGDRLVFAVDIGTQNSRIYSMPWYGGPWVNLTPTAPEYFFDFAGSVGGHAIIRDGLASKYKLYSISLYGGNFVRLTDSWIYRANSEKHHLDQTSETVILREANLGGHGLFSIDPSGPQTYRLTPDLLDPHYFCTTTNRMVYAAEVDGQHNMYSVAYTGGQITTLDDSPGFEMFMAIAVTAGSEHHQGYLSAGQSQYRPDPYFYAAAGTHTATLEGAAGTDFDLYLHKWTGSYWSSVAQSTSWDSTEDISYQGGAGYYRWKIYAYSGSGSYDLWITRP